MISLIDVMKCQFGYHDWIFMGKGHIEYKGEKMNAGKHYIIDRLNDLGNYYVCRHCTAEKFVKKEIK